MLNAMNRWSLLVFCGALTFSLTACPKKQVKKTADDQAVEEAKNGEDVESEELDIRDKDFVESPDLQVVYFDYDSNELSEASRQTLAANTDSLKKLKNIEILVEGHCDERGTVGYNLALGQKRAQTVRKYYISLGVNPKTIGSLSFGKEKTVCSDATEECWAKNRRVITKVRTQKVVNGKDKEHDKE